MAANKVGTCQPAHPSNRATDQPNPMQLNSTNVQEKHETVPLNATLNPKWHGVQHEWFKVGGWVGVDWWRLFCEWRWGAAADPPPSGTTCSTNGPRRTIRSFCFY